MIAVVGTVVEARDQECWTNRHITRQRKEVVAVVVGERNQGVHSRREGVAARQSHQAEVGSFGRREDVLVAEQDDLLFSSTAC